MDKIKKLLAKLNAKELRAILLVMQQIQLDHSKVPGIKKLKGHSDLYRVRVGKYRIIFKIDEAASNAGEIVRITKRNEDSYKDL
jgi:mRNA-degrading endonuclease RelE of RelBE toxin-antitoxin system